MPDLPAWNTRATAMTPLVAAYDGRIDELEQLNKIQVRAFFEFDWIGRHPPLVRVMNPRAHMYVHAQAEKLGALAGRVEALVNENEGLLEELQALNEQKEGAADGDGDGNGGGPLVQMLTAENAALQEEAEAVRGGIQCIFIIRYPADP